jgi:2-(1,2-epoxy-1,2-dihydrophenyl)acetyl-CoA isomerase
VSAPTWRPSRPKRRRRAAPTRWTRLLAQGGNPLVLALNALPVPVLCAVHGAVAGGGVGLALAADLVIAARSAYFYLPFVPALGLVPDMGASWFLTRALGPARTKALMLTGQRLGAEQAADWGLIWRCVDDEALDDEAAPRAPAGGVAAQAALEVRALMRKAEAQRPAAQLEHERARQRQLIAGPSFEAGLQAFVQKRPPVFEPR